MKRFGSELTTRASCLLAAGLTALVCGLVLGEADLSRAGMLALVIPLVALLVVQRSRVQLANSRSVEPGRLVTGENVVLHLAVANKSRLPTGALMLEDQLPSQLQGRARFVLDGLSGRETRTVSYRLPGLPRGQYRSGPLRVRLTDPFHMVEVLRSFEATSALTVAPIVEQLPGVDPPRSNDIGDNAGSHSIGTHGADDASTREYRTGDDLRKIHWRSSARTGALMVRQEERPWQGQTAIMLDLRTSAHTRRSLTADEPAGDERRRDSMEWAISAAASIGVHLLLAHRGVELISDPTAAEALPVTDPTQLREHLAGVRAVRQSDYAGAGAVIARVARESALIAVLGATDAITLRVLTESFHRSASGSAFALVLDTDAWAAIPDSGETPVIEASPAQLTAQTLRTAGWQAVVVRPTDSVAAVWATLVRSRAGISPLGVR
ncbi:MAG: DUF58 domain-containing protein [Jatrophihabitantaceae bacterium]